MGNRPSAEPTPQSNQGLLIDESGNICRPGPPQNPRPPAGNIQLRDSRSGGRFGSLSDLPAGAEGGQQPQGLQAVLPRFTLRSIVGVICAVQVIVYMISCWVITPRELYTPNFLANWKLGSSDHTMEQCALKVGGKFIVELRRFFTPIFLHMNIVHLVGNISVQVLWGPRMLATYGAEWYAGLFLAAGACGNMLSDAFAIGGMGASTSCAGLIGAFLAQVWLVWDSLGEAWKEWVRNILMLATAVVLIIEVILWNVVNHLGHLGGLLGGFALAVVLTHEPPLPLIPSNVPALPANIAKRRQLCGTFLALFTIACLCKIFILDPPPTVQVPGINGTLVETNGTQALCESRWAAYSG